MTAILLALALLLATTPAGSARKTASAAFLNQAGGLNVKDSPLSMPAGDVLESRNIDYDIPGSWATRQGFSKHNSAAITDTPSVTGLFEWVQSDTTRKFFAAASDGAIYEDVAGTWTSRKTGLTTGENLWDFANWKGTSVLGCNGQDQMQESTDGTTWAALAAPPAGVTTCAFVEVHKNRLWMVAKNGTTVYYSNVDTLSFTASGSGSIVIGDDSEGNITGAHSAIGVLLALKERAVHVISGATAATFAAALLAVNVGTTSNNSIATVHSPSGTDVFFASHQGIHSLRATEVFGDFQPTLVSTKIETYWRKDLNRSRFNKIAAVYYPGLGQYWASVTSAGQTQNDRIVKFDTRAQAWSVMEGAKSLSLAIRQDSTGEKEVYHGDFAGFVYEHHKTTYTDAGTAYTSLVRTAWLNLGRPDRKKLLRLLTIFYEPKGDVTLNVEYLLDSDVVETKTITMTGGGIALGTFTLNTDKLGGDKAISTAAISLKNWGHFVQFAFYVTAGGKDFRVYGFVVDFEVEE